MLNVVLDCLVGDIESNFVSREINNILSIILFSLDVYCLTRIDISKMLFPGNTNILNGSKIKHLVTSTAGHKLILLNLTT